MVVLLVLTSSDQLLSILERYIFGIHYLVHFFPKSVPWPKTIYYIINLT
jgi:hypothetical protein